MSNSSKFGEDTMNFERYIEVWSFVQYYNARAHFAAPACCGILRRRPADYLPLSETIFLVFL